MVNSPGGGTVTTVALGAGREPAGGTEPGLRGAAAGGSPPKVCRAISAMPPRAPRIPAVSIGIRKVFWFGECAKAASASTYFCATK